jgi:hypothetical protein
VSALGPFFSALLVDSKNHSPGGPPLDERKTMLSGNQDKMEKERAGPGLRAVLISSTEISGSFSNRDLELSKMSRPNFCSSTAQRRTLLLRTEFSFRKKLILVKLDKSRLLAECDTALPLYFKTVLILLEECFDEHLSLLHRLGWV